MLTYLVAFFILGLLLGSFANVCIYRMPLEQSIVSPRSHCPGCKHQINWYDNVPLLSFIALKGKCRYCGAGIPLQYPMVELLTGIVFASIAWRYPLQPILPVYLFVALLLIIISGIDFFYQIIPDLLCFMIAIAGVGSSFFNLSLGNDWKLRLLHSVGGGIFGALSLLIAGYAGKKIFKQEAMGEGDVKLLGGLGALLGIPATVSTLFAASLAGSMAGMALIFTKKMRRRDYLPFGPFIALGAYFNILFPEILMNFFR